MKCLICRTKFFHQTHGSPAEDCDCGANLSRLALRESDEPVDLPTLRREWQARQAEADATGATDAA